MRSFSYYLYDNFDMDEAEVIQENPRKVLTSELDAILSEIVDADAGLCRWDDMCRKYSMDRMEVLLKTGLVRRECDAVLLDSTTIVHEDIPVIRRFGAEHAEMMADLIEYRKMELYALMRKIQNGFDEKVNLYHILCGAVFDGAFFDYLSEKGILSTSRQHDSGLDYLAIVYEKDAELEQFSNQLLCSYNRYTDGSSALQSFGDSNGNRRDFFRFSCQKLLGMVPPELQQIEKDWDAVYCPDFKQRLFAELHRFDEIGELEASYERILEDFGYLADGKYNVPVFRKNDIQMIQQVAQIAVECVGNDMIKALNSSKRLEDMLCQKHRSPGRELSNEMYHILFGMLNEELVSRGIVSSPEFHEGEGRYLMSIEMM